MKSVPTVTPVFILGSSRSGTTLMATMLAASGQFASYNAEPLLLYSCGSKYGSLRNGRSRRRFLNDWFQSRQFHRSGLSRTLIETLAKEHDSFFGFHSAFMYEIAASQGKPAWIDSTPSNGYVIDRIADFFPTAKFIHMVRDGRGVAMSLAKLGWTGAKTSNAENALFYSALKWKIATESILRSKTRESDRYMQVKFEDLVRDPAQTLLSILRKFSLEVPDLDEPVDYDGKRGNFSFRFSKSNSAFGDVHQGISEKPAHRWRHELTAREIQLIEQACSDLLLSLGYSLVGNTPRSTVNKIWSALAEGQMRTKQWLKRRTPLGRLSESPLEIGKL